MKPARRIALALPFIVLANVFDWLAARMQECVDAIAPRDGVA